VLERPFALDPTAHILRERIPPGLIWAGVQHQDKLVFAWGYQSGEGL
jgi:hypothetical protein